MKLPESIDREWSWRCTNCGRYGRIHPDRWDDHILFVFPRHWESDHMIEVWATGARHTGMYVFRRDGVVVADESMFNQMHPRPVES